MLMKATPCDEHGNYLPPYTPPPPPEEDPPPKSWVPFESRVEFDFAHYHFIKVQSSAANINKALDMRAATVMESGGDTPGGILMTFTRLLMPFSMVTHLGRRTTFNIKVPYCRVHLKNG
jgi:hypothetical protein